MSLLDNSKARNGTSVQEKLISLGQAAVRPLPPTGQADGKAVGFFDAAFLIVGGTIVSAMGTGLFFAVRHLRRR